MNLLNCAGFLLVAIGGEDQGGAPVVFLSCYESAAACEAEATGPAPRDFRGLFGLDLGARAEAFCIDMREGEGA